MSTETVSLYAVIADEGVGKNVKISCDGYTPDSHEELRDAVYDLIDIGRLSERERIGKAVFDRHKSNLTKEDFEIRLSENAEKYRWETR
jgi:hypothetical protein